MKKEMTKEEANKIYERLQGQICEENECTFLECLEKGHDSFKFELKNGLTNDEIYRDMSPVYCDFFDRSFFSTYLKLGIQRLDSWMSKQIQMKDSKYPPEVLAKMIRCNYHLHNVIKTDLLNNLKNYSGYDGFDL